PSRVVGQPDSGLHHHADRAGGRFRRRRRLHHLVVGAGHQHDPGLRQAELRPEPGADRSPRQGEFGQIFDPEGIERSDRDQDKRQNHVRAAAGHATGYFIVSNISTNTDLRNLEQFKKMIVKSKDGGFVRIEDIASVELAAQSSDASVAFSGERAIFIGVQATPQGNPLTLVKGVRALFPELERNLPPSMKMKVAYDSTKFIQSSIDEVKNTLIEAVLIVVVVIFLFLASFRSVIIPVVTIPLSLLGGCTLMLIIGFSFNLLTLLAMFLAIGLVVDDAIVVVENIHRHLEEGKPPVQAAT